jgi:hypothetical protein
MRSRVRIGLAVFFLVLTAWLSSAQSNSSPAALFKPYEGTYRLPAGKNILISRMGVTEEVARPYFLDWQTGRFGYLTAKETDRFTVSASPNAKPDTPVQTEIVFSRNAGGGRRRIDHPGIGPGRTKSVPHRSL